jgi:hypothetical protein
LQAIASHPMTELAQLIGNEGDLNQTDSRCMRCLKTLGTLDKRQAISVVLDLPIPPAIFSVLVRRTIVEQLNAHRWCHAAGTAGADPGESGVI